MIDGMITLFNFLLFVVCCCFLARRHGRAVASDMLEERSRYKRLVEYRAGLKKQVAGAERTIAMQVIVCEDLAHKVEQWRRCCYQEQAAKRLVYEEFATRAVDRYQHQMHAYALQKLEERVCHKAVAHMRTELVRYFEHEGAAGTRYNERSVRDLRSSVEGVHG